MHKSNRLALFFMIFALAFTCLINPLFSDNAAAAEDNDFVYLIPIEGDIDNSQILFIERSYQEAMDNHAAAIIFEIDTYGGYVDSAITIADLILASPIPTYTLVNSKAISAGALIALAGETLIMTPGATMGAAEPRIFNETADEKTVSFWAGKLAATAEARGKDSQIAAAMADTTIIIEGLSDEGGLLTLTAEQCLEWNMADNILNTVADVQAEYQLPQTIISASPSWQENLGGWLSDPIISGILLTIGIAGIAIEIATVGSFGIFGAAGLLSFALYFTGHFFVGNIGLGAIFIFIIGLILIILEIFVVPGFGVVGTLGILSILASLIMASGNIWQAIVTLALAIAAAVIIVAITIKNRRTRKIWSKLILFHKQEGDGGYNSANMALNDYIGAKGLAITPLRPAGTAEINGKRIDVVSEGSFIDANQQIEVVAVEGMRVIVQPAK